MSYLVDPLAHTRASARTADKYVTRTGGAADAPPFEVKARQSDERQMLAIAIEHVRRGLGGGFNGRAAALELKKIEAVLVRDYGLYSRIVPLRDPD